MSLRPGKPAPEPPRERVRFVSLGPENADLAAEALATFRTNLQEVIDSHTKKPRKRTPFKTSDAETIRKQLAEGKLKGRLAIHKDRAVGVIIYSPFADPTAPHPDFIWISALWVDAAARMKGIGRRLLVEACAIENSRALIPCDSHNRPALAFYKRIGGRHLRHSRTFFFNPA